MEAVFRWADPVTGFIRFHPEPTGTWQNRLPDTVTGFLRRIPDISWRVPARNSAFPAGFPRKFMEYCFRNHRPGKRSEVCNALAQAEVKKETIAEPKSFLREGIQYLFLFYFIECVSYTHFLCMWLYDMLMLNMYRTLIDFSLKLPISYFKQKILWTLFRWRKNNSLWFIVFWSHKFVDCLNMFPSFLYICVKGSLANE